METTKRALDPDDTGSSQNQLSHQTWARIDLLNTKKIESSKIKVENTHFYIDCSVHTSVFKL
jgi:hypothetical protein